MARRLILLVLAWAVLGSRFSCVPAPEQTGDPTLIADLWRVMKAASAGYPLQLAPGVSINKAAYDIGMFFYPSVVVTGLRGWVRADLSLWLWLQLGFTGAACAVMLMPGVPLRLGAGGVAALLVGVCAAGVEPLAGMFAFHYYGYWAPPLGGIL